MVEVWRQGVGSGNAVGNGSERLYKLVTHVLTINSECDDNTSTEDGLIARAKATAVVPDHTFPHWTRKSIRERACFPNGYKWKDRAVGSVTSSDRGHNDRYPLERS